MSGLPGLRTGEAALPGSVPGTKLTITEYIRRAFRCALAVYMCTHLAQRALQLRDELQHGVCTASLLTSDAALSYEHMDMEYTFWQMFSLVAAPPRVCVRPGPQPVPSTRAAHVRALLSVSSAVRARSHQPGRMRSKTVHSACETRSFCHFSLMLRRYRMTKLHKRAQCEPSLLLPQCTSGKPCTLYFAGDRRPVCRPPLTHARLLFRRDQEPVGARRPCVCRGADRDDGRGVFRVRPTPGPEHSAAYYS